MAVYTKLQKKEINNITIIDLIILSKLDLAFRDKIFFTDSDNLLMGIFPLFNFSAIRLIPLETFVDIKIISFPTSKALRSTFISGS